MTSAIHIGNDIASETLVDAAEAIATILRAAFDSHSDQKTVRVALAVLGKYGTVSDITLSGCSVIGPRDD